MWYYAELEKNNLSYFGQYFFGGSNYEKKV